MARIRQIIVEYGMRPVARALMVHGRLYVPDPLTLEPGGCFAPLQPPPPGHPERLRPDLPPSGPELRLSQELRTGTPSRFGR